MHVVAARPAQIAAFSSIALFLSLPGVDKVRQNSSIPGTRISDLISMTDRFKTDRRAR